MSLQISRSSGSSSFFRRSTSACRSAKEACLPLRDVVYSQGSPSKSLESPGEQLLVPRPFARLPERRDGLGGVRNLALRKSVNPARHARAAG